MTPMIFYMIKMCPSHEVLQTKIEVQRKVSLTQEFSVSWKHVDFFKGWTPYLEKVSSSWGKWFVISPYGAKGSLSKPTCPNASSVQNYKNIKRRSKHETFLRDNG